jgi:hypothetical protein
MPVLAGDEPRVAVATKGSLPIRLVDDSLAGTR